jgi:hypothetical protein
MVVVKSTWSAPFTLCGDALVVLTTNSFMAIVVNVIFSSSVWSPQSRGKIELPPLGLEIEDDLLSSKPITPDCVVLLAQPDIPCIWYCRIGGDTQWTKHEYDIGTQAAIPEYDLTEEKVVICPIAGQHGKSVLPRQHLKAMHECQRS